MSIAFFDVDGTLLPHPSLERRFFWYLARRGKLRAANYSRWVAEMIRLCSNHFATAAPSNKMYLRGVSATVLSELCSAQNRPWMPEFLPAAMQRIWWHALRGDKIVLVTGTLAPLAEIIKASLERELLWRGVESQLVVFATELGLREGSWTGTVEGQPRFGEAKAAAVKQFALAAGVPLTECFAYGDHELDRSMLEAVGTPVAVNPTWRLRQIARQRGWQIMKWPAGVRRTAPPQALKWKGQVAR
jgi:HAD superfamily hydrolase (TIGR01490 family)